MSGSSMDGVDLACCEFSHDHSKWSFKILAARPYPIPLHSKKNWNRPVNWAAEEIDELDRELGYSYAGLLNEFHRTIGLDP